MGILDDAIREHLDLKRRLGAEDTELARLEDEAFGPPTRPGDPDFPEDKPAGDVAVADPATGEVPGTPEEQVADEVAVAEPLSEELPAQPPPAAQEPPPAPPSEEPEPETSAFYDHEGGELDLDLELDEDEDLAEAPPVAAEPESEELSAVPETADEPAVDPTPTPEREQPVEAPIESHDTVEHHFEGAIEDTGGGTEVVEDTGEAEVVQGEDTGEAEVVQGELADEPEGAEDDDGDDDVLEETPEFLRDQPEDDELWFEQGEPKDFDF
jgi:hypothetical protein